MPKFMVIMPGDAQSEAGHLPPPELFAEMNVFNDELAKAGVLLSAEGLKPTSAGAKVRFDDDERRTVIDGPFTEATGPDGEPVLLLDQDRAKWDWSQIERGLKALARADAAFAAAEAADPTEPGTYHLQAALAACHARARTAEATDWHLIADLYDRLVRLTRSPVVELNRAVAVGMAEGPAAGLAITDALVGLRAMQGYHLLPSVRGDLLSRLGRHAEARAEFERAAELTANMRERALLIARANAQNA